MVGGGAECDWTLIIAVRVEELIRGEGSSHESTLGAKLGHSLRTLAVVDLAAIAGPLFIRA